MLDIKNRLADKNSKTTLKGLLGMCMLVIGLAATPANAQKIVTTGFNGGSAGYQVKGTNLLVNAGGGLLGAGGVCPFFGKDVKTYYEKAVEAAKTGTNPDPDGCPHALNNRGNRIYLNCGAYYWEKSAATGKDPNTSIICCHKTTRKGIQNCQQEWKRKIESVKADKAGLLVKTGTISDDASEQSPKTAQEILTKKKEKAEAEKQCFDGTMDSITEKFAQNRHVKCAKFITAVVKQLIAHYTREIKDQVATETQISGSSTQTQGAVTAIVSTPSIWGGILTAKSIGNLAANLGLLATQASNLLDTLSSQCGGVLTQIKELNDWRKGLLNGLCTAAENLIDRQLSQCIRVNVGFDLRLPQFSLVLQCPINVNVNARIGSDGFRCFNNVSLQNPVTASFGGRSILSGDGGMENLFNGDCFTKSTATVAENVADGEGSRVPGVDCGPLDKSNTMKQQTLQGTYRLKAGSGNDGWIVGDSETLANNGQSIQITRCDYYSGGQSLRTAYVFGGGSSCNGGADGFLENGYETSTSCYPGGGYKAVAGLNLPDACMYPKACLDTAEKFDENLLGVGNCPSDAKNTTEAVFAKASSLGDFNQGYNVQYRDPTAKPGEQKFLSCLNLGRGTANVVCCDPSKQDCSVRDANVPICQCNEGDLTNVVAPGDPYGRCEQGGNKTCCSPRANSANSGKLADGRAWCDSNKQVKKVERDEATGQYIETGEVLFDMEICESEKEDQCVGSTEAVQYNGAAGATLNGLQAGQVALLKPSPYVYLFVRPDAKIGTTQCCMTEWCNLCPQHYANAYGLSLVRDDSLANGTVSGDLVIGNFADSNKDYINNRLLGKGWPYDTIVGADGITRYSTPMQRGSNSVTVRITNYFRKTWPKLNVWRIYEKDNDFPFNTPPLSLSPSMERPINAAFNACNDISPNKMVQSSSSQFSDAEGGSSDGAIMGVIFDRTTGVGGKKGKKDVWTMAAAVPTPKEMPLEYLNRIRLSYAQDQGQEGFEEIKLCSEAVPICYSPTLANGAVSGNQAGGVNSGNGGIPFYTADGSNDDYQDEEDTTKQTLQQILDQLKANGTGTGTSTGTGTGTNTNTNTNTGGNYTDNGTNENSYTNLRVAPAENVAPAPTVTPAPRATAVPSAGGGTAAPSLY